jgi:hypothetical protein
MENENTGRLNLERFRTLIPILLGIALLASVFAEGYYIFALRDIIEKQSEELKNTSMQLQSLRNARSSLQEELDSIKKMAGDGKDGTTPQRQR